MEECWESAEPAVLVRGVAQQRDVCSWLHGDEGKNHKLFYVSAEVAKLD